MLLDELRSEPRPADRLNESLRGSIFRAGHYLRVSEGRVTPGCVPYDERGVGVPHSLAVLAVPAVERAPRARGPVS